MSQINIKPVSYNLWAKDKPAFAKAFGESFAETGFAVVSDHTIPADVRILAYRPKIAGG